MSFKYIVQSKIFGDPTPNKRRLSVYVGLSTEICLPFSKVQDLAEPKHIGRLSERDILGLITKYNEYKN